MYQPISFTHKQFARWVELTAGKRNPFCKSNYLGENLSSDLTKYLKNSHGIRIGKYDWATTMLLLAVPFANKVVTAVVPNGYQIHPVVSDMADRYRVQVRTTSLSMFSQKKLNRMGLNYMVPVISHESDCVYPKWVEKAIGERPSEYRNLVPDSCLHFGNDTS